MCYVSGECCCGLPYDVNLKKEEKMKEENDLLDVEIEESDIDLSVLFLKIYQKFLDSDCTPNETFDLAKEELNRVLFFAYELMSEEEDE